MSNPNNFNTLSLDNYPNDVKDLILRSQKDPTFELGDRRKKVKLLVMTPKAQRRRMKRRGKPSAIRI